MEWTRIEAGEYWSIDDRFHIIKVWNRIYNSHWLLIDCTSKKSYPRDSLKECKLQAEKLSIEN